MNKVFFIIVLLLFAGCSTNNNIENYNEDNPLLGIWNCYDNTGLLITQKIYTVDQYSYFSIIDGLEVKNIDPQGYVIHKNRIIFKRYTQTYKIDLDTLWITNSHGDQITKYIRKVIAE